MAYDGIAISAVRAELEDALIGGHIDKVFQPEYDEIILSVRNAGKSYRLLMSANASHPRVHFTEISKDNPMTPPLFCMVLRKHIIGRITDKTQEGLERIVTFHIESLNEMGDHSTKKLIIEIMGKHSNIILADEDGKIIDCAKHITHDKSSVREVLPGKEYVLPPSQDKASALEMTRESFLEKAENCGNQKAQQFIYYNYTGIAPITASEICAAGGIDPSEYVSGIAQDKKEKLFESFEGFIKRVCKKEFSPRIIYDKNGKIIDFSPIEMKQFDGFENEKFESMSVLLERFYRKKDSEYRISQKTHDLRKLIMQNIERCSKKKDMQISTMKEIKDRDKLKLCGELITANIYAIKKGMNTVMLQNFYSEDAEETAVKLDPNLTPAENAQKYFKKYNKEKRTYAALLVQMKENDEELEYLQTVLTSLKSCANEQDIKQIREELANEGFIKKLSRGKKGASSQKKAKPLHFVSSDGFDIYVGKNNTQNDELTLRFARNNDIWLHTKIIPGSHVIIVTNGEEVPDNTLNEAANLAAYYSQAQNSTQVPIDYTEKKNVKKPSGAKPGMVIYKTNRTVYINPSEEEVKKLKKIE